MNYADVSSRANAIEKWVAVADICRCLHNYNGVLEITSALNRSAIYRLKKTWAKVSKQSQAPYSSHGRKSLFADMPTRLVITSAVQLSLFCI
ncbi:Ras-specific guanine nucleotide-releasing factor 2 [Saguinus oedipus]|uniref:Ras-specific guanine nucleotide-releasing factor 2 n=1 Tax=Saguinus oedipus TaxID=9490 RepID=A0ABQ9W8X1_SAGOE|nr:Ras-specific guanine nucleotide-releasing factor 2 [Saguinus oedipus]